MRQWFYPTAVAGDLKRAFLPVRIREADLSELEVLRFTGALFGLSLHLLLGRVINCHLETWEAKIQNLWLSFKETCV